MAQAAAGPVALAVGRVEAGAEPPEGVALHRCRALASPVAATRGLDTLEALLGEAAVVHVHNVMNPLALARAVETGRAVVTVQDHRVFCPGPGHSLPTGARCDRVFGDGACASCLPDPDYRARTVALTAARREGLRGAVLVVLSQYMAGALAAAGLPGAQVLSPPVTAADTPGPLGDHLLIAGRLVGHKGVDLLHAAWEAAGRPLPLKVAGDGPLRDALPGAEHLGWLSRPAWRAAARAARAVLVAPRWQEPFGIAGLEALAEGTALAGWATGGMAEWCHPGLLAIPAGDTEQLAGLMVRLSWDEELCRVAGHAGWQRVRERPGPGALHGVLQGIYDRVSSLSRSSR